MPSNANSKSQLKLGSTIQVSLLGLEMLNMNYGGSNSKQFLYTGLLPRGHYGMVYMIERYVMGTDIMISTYVLWTFIPLIGIYNNYGINNAPIDHVLLT